MDNEMLLNEAATKDSFEKQLYDADLILLATHAKSNMDSPEKSFIAFYRENPYTPEEKYKLYLDDISKLHLKAKMVVLSACQTNLGQVFKGEGAMSLANSCFYAGAQSVVSSLWDAEDMVTSELMDEFTSNLDLGMPKDKAMQLAQIKHLNTYTGFRSNPLFWAGFSVMGSTDSLQFVKSPEYSKWAMTFFGVIIIVLIATNYSGVYRKKLLLSELAALYLVFAARTF